MSLLTGAIGGVIGGLTGVGGSAFMIPLMMRRGGMVAHRAHGTALAVVVAVAIAGSATYIANDLVEWDLVASLLGGSLIGAYAGAALAVRLSAARLQLVFALFFVGVALRMLVG
ncbi:MAG: hypothetical protein DK306_001784 [Chloroflexi bacterium]|nr:MAG: hypothetical protein DK306_001784 [Chloroflexota bacterium]